MNKKINSLDLFAGAGGLSLGIKKAGFNSYAMLELDKTSCETLKSNFVGSKIFQKDIRDFAKKPIKFNKKIDLITGGFPCQPFSYAGQKKGLKDVRGTLFYDYVKIINFYKPKAILTENVKGLISLNKGQDFKKVLEMLEKSGYKNYYKVLNAWDYNCPQKRLRLFIISIRKDLNKKFNFPKTNPTKPVLKDFIKNLSDQPGAKYNERKKRIMDLVPAGGCWRDLPKKIAKEYMKGSYYLGGGKTGIARRLSWNEPSLTLTCSPAQTQTERCHPDETRPLNIKEYAAIQTFPKNFNFKGSLNQIYRQIGNAVPVNLAKAVCLELMKIYKD